MINKFFYLFVIFIFGLLPDVSAQTIEKIGIEQGLSNNNIASISQDIDGFIWIATKDGLNRLDANTFRIYRTTGQNEKQSHCGHNLSGIYVLY